MAAYLRPTALDDALTALATPVEGAWCLLAGGTELCAGPGDRLADRDVLDLGALPELQGIEPDGEGWRIGARCTWSELLDAGLPAGSEALTAAARQLGSPQIQNTGSIGGNLCGGGLCPDGAVALLALGARLELAGPAGRRETGLDAFLCDADAALRPGELLLAVRLPDDLGRGRSGYRRVSVHAAPSPALVAAALWLARDEAGRVTEARLALGGCSPRPCRLPEAERALPGLSAADELAARLGDDVTAGLMPPVADADEAAWRRHAGAVLLRRLLREAGAAA